MPRKLRIAVSMFFGVLTLLLVVMWVRSYFVSDAFHSVDESRFTSVGFTNGSAFYIRAGTLGMSNFGWDYQQSEPAEDSPAYQWASNGGHVSLLVPIWCFVAVTACGTYAPFGLLRFSLRSLLIATTLVALVLGLTAWAGR